MKHLVRKLTNRSMWSRRGGIWTGIVLATLSLPALAPMLMPQERHSRDSDGRRVTSPVEPTTPLDDTAIADEPEAPPVSTTSVAGTDVVAVPVSAADTGDDEPADNAVARADVIGTWKLEYQGQRVVTMRDDGSAVMRVSLDFFGALLYGESLTLELEWTLEDGILTHRVIRGEPKQNVAKLIRDFGDARSYRVVSCGDELVLEAVDSPDDVYRWTAVTDDATNAAVR